MELLYSEEAEAMWTKQEEVWDRYLSIDNSAPNKDDKP